MVNELLSALKMSSMLWQLNAMNLREMNREISREFLPLTIKAIRSSSLVSYPDRHHNPSGQYGKSYAAMLDAVYPTSNKSFSAIIQNTNEKAKVLIDLLITIKPKELSAFKKIFSLIPFYEQFCCKGCILI